ncbi:2,3-bisphosphoglycerate-independent phosphoglycerate mutase [Candidatus Saccharibacteria bacterium]|nr:2,3-bisphosphoglycerate-independent phosphoglycerate mutase [Candidatus Saccharibacteria bacterium]
MNKLAFEGPIVLAVMDGVGIAPSGKGNAVSLAHTEFLDRVSKEYLNIPLAASGEAVGILKGDMGNSEVGHNALGSGQIIKQGIAEIEDAFSSGKIWDSAAWQKVIDNVLSHKSTLHFSGIFSDGNVHSTIVHLEKMIIMANARGVEKIRVHLVFDGRDVPPQSEPKYINRLETFFKRFADRDYKIASGAGRMVAVADRYENDWAMVKLGWDMFFGVSRNHFRSAAEAVETFRKQDPKIQDQYLPPFIVVDDKDQPVGKVEKGDSFIYYDFRADRAIEIAQAFTYIDFPYFNRGNYSPDDIIFAGMTEYNSDTHVPENQLVPPVQIHDPLNQFLGKNHVSQLAVSETVKFGHITYYFNGNSYDKAEGEDHIKIDSDTLPFDTRPWMKSAEIADAVLDNLDKYKFVRLNFPGGDMVGHFAEIEPTITAMEAIDLQLQRLAKKVDELKGILIITADHGNAEELLDDQNEPKTSHTTNKVPCIFYDNTENRGKYIINDIKDAGLSNVAANIDTLLNIENLPKSWRKPLIVVK